MIQRACWDVLSGGANEDRKQLAWDWIMDESEDNFTFRWACSAIGLEDVGALRRLVCCDEKSRARVYRALKRGKLRMRKHPWRKHGKQKVSYTDAAAPGN